jgi:small subunit ribosomal protein S16
MAVRLRLARHGTNSKPYYRIVAADSRMKRDGRYLEQLGTYDTLANPARVNLVKDRIEYWLSVGATASETVSSLIAQHLPELVKVKARPAAKKAASAPEKPAAAAPAPAKPKAAAKPKASKAEPASGGTK